MFDGLHICVLLDAYDHASGVNTTYRSQMHLAPQLGLRLTVITTAERGVEPLRDDAPYQPVRVRSRFSLRMPFARNIRVDWPDKRALRDLVEALEPDLIHTVAPGPVGIYGGALAGELGLPLVSYYHTDYLSMQHPDVLRSSMPYPLAWVASRFTPAFVNYTDRLLYQHAGLVCCESEKTRRQVLARGLNANPVVVPATLRHDFDMAAANPDAFRRRWGLAADRPVALFVGRFAPDKNVPLIAAAAQRCPEVIFVAMGEGPQARLLHGLPNVILTGRLDGADVWSGYAAADLLIMPSWEETFGLVSLEAMAAGLPVLTADTAGSAPEVLATGAGVGFSPQEAARAPDRFAALLRALLADDSRRAAMSACARDWAAHNRPLDRYRRFVETAYLPLVDYTPARQR